MESSVRPFFLLRSFYFFFLAGAKILLEALRIIEKTSSIVHIKESIGIKIKKNKK